MLPSLSFLDAAALLSILFPTTTKALEWLGPRATLTPSLSNIQGWNPKPTDGPRLHVAANGNLELKRLFRRQVPLKYANTCGYVDGNENYSYTCSGQYACAYNTGISAFGCCVGTLASNGAISFTGSCNVDTATTSCYDSTEADRCKGTCTTSALICSESTAPVCRTVLQYGTDYLDSVTYTEYNCVLLGAKTKLSLQNSYSFSSFMNWGPLLESGYSYDESKTSIVPMTGSDSPSTPTTTTTITGVTTTSTSPPPPSSTVPVPVPSNRNTGAIAGGVVGGLAGLGLIVGGLIWALMRRKEKARRNATSVQEVSHVTVMHDGK